MTKEEKKQHNREILAAWKQEKKEKRLLCRERRKAQPFWVKILKAAASVVVAAVVIGFIVYSMLGSGFFLNQLYETVEKSAYVFEKMTAEEIHKESDFNQEAADKVQAMKSDYGKNDKWAVYIYMIGSDLESTGKNYLSPVVEYNANQIREANEKAFKENAKKILDVYFNAVENEGMELPSPMYATASHEKPAPEVDYDMDFEGAAWKDLMEILKADISDNVDVVVETGGAKRWSNEIINPNRKQIFSIKDKHLEEEVSMPVSSMSSTESVADFLSYCEKNHNADHKIVIFWDHGGAAFGYGKDEIYGRLLSLKEMKAAFEKVYGKNPAKAPFEVIGFDACLMATAETLDAFGSYGKYLAGSEEAEPGYGWYYTNWLTELSANPGMNGAQAGRLIADDYMDFYKAQNISQYGQFCGIQSVCFSVLDMREGSKIYGDYAKLVKKVLSDTVSKPEALTELSRSAHDSIHYCEEIYDVYNTVDLGILIDNLKSVYPEECAKIREDLDKAVIYNRADENLKGSQGVTIYFPDSMKKLNSLRYLMDYVLNITDVDEIRDLYFYKAAGCFSEDMKKSMKASGLQIPENIDIAALKQVVKPDPVITSEGNFTLAVPEKARKYIQDYNYDLGKFDDETDGILDYGQADSMAVMDSAGNLTTDFNGLWPCLEGQPLALEVLQTHNGITTFRSAILLNGKDASLIYSYDSEEKKFSISGAYYQTEQAYGDLIGRNVSDLKKGSKITPVYESSDGRTTETVSGKAVKYSENTEIKYEKLDDGSYVAAVFFTDVRNDDFVSKVVSFDIKNGKPANTKLDDTVYAKAD